MTIDRIKNEYAQRFSFEDWNELKDSIRNKDLETLEFHMDEINILTQKAYSEKVRNHFNPSELRSPSDFLLWTSYLADDCNLITKR